MNKTLYIFSLLLFLCASCNKAEMALDAPEFIPELVNVSFRADLDGKTKISYHPDANNKKFYPIWNTGDLVSVVTDLDKDLISPFTVKSDGSNASIHGKINRWRGKTNVYAIYPHKECAYDHEGGVFTVNISSQTIDGKVPNKDSHNTTDNAMKNAFLLAKAKDVTIEEDGNTDIDNLHFRQAMSFLRFTLVHEGHELRRITLRSEKSDFYEQAKISYDDNGIDYDYDKSPTTNELYSDNITADPSGTSIINFALFPTTLNGFELEIQTICDNKTYIFTKTVANTVDFKRNEFSYFSDDLNVNSLDCEVVGALDLGDITDTTEPPAGNNWVIKSEEEITNNTQLWKVRNLIIKSERDISLKFVNTSMLKCNFALQAPGLVTLELTNCKEIGNETFGGCPDLRKVILPNLEKAGVNNFYHLNQGNGEPIEFIAGTNTNKPLIYGNDGDEKQMVTPESANFKYLSLEKVHITLRKENFTKEEYEGNYIKNANDDRPIYFGSITWI